MFAIEFSESQPGGKAVIELRTEIAGRKVKYHSQGL